MLKVFLTLLLLFQDAPVALTAPQNGETLRGQVQIQGRMDTPNFASAELAFTFASNASDSGGNWFIIQTFPQPTADFALTVWDTTSITDGDYTLRLRVFLQDGTFQDALVSDLKIRNDEPLPTATVPPTLQDFDFQPLNETPGAPAQSTATPAISYPTSTPLPANPASLTTASILTIFWQSALFILVVFLFFSLILRLRKNS
ncbi:MAG TPA: hypothetical protein DCY14_15985 [Anaerolineae bacterium]|nr:hypothetical protein [Anaerolineae bacterium]HRJ57096.1 hypothetical protein [Anaerolineales bacterium]